MLRGVLLRGARAVHAWQWADETRECAYDIPAEPGDVVVDASDLDAELFYDVHDHLSRYTAAEVLELVEPARVETIPADLLAPAGEALVYQPGFRRVCARPLNAAIEAALLAAKRQNARDRAAGRPATAKEEPVHAFERDVAASEGTERRRAVFPLHTTLHTFADGEAAVRRPTPPEALPAGPPGGSQRAGTAPNSDVGPEDGEIRL